MTRGISRDYRAVLDDINQIDFPQLVTDYSDRERDHLVFSDATNDGGTSLNETSAYFRGGRNLFMIGVI